MSKLINEHDQTKLMLNVLREFDESQETQPQQTPAHGEEASESDLADQNDSLKSVISDGIINSLLIFRPTTNSPAGAVASGTITSMGGMEWRLSLNEPGVPNGLRINSIQTDGGNGIEINGDTIRELSSFNGWCKNFLNNFGETLNNDYKDSTIG